MNKLASIFITCLVVFWLRIGLTPALQDDKTMSIAFCLTAVWLIVFGSYYGWLVLLIMVRQLAAAIRGK